MTNASSAAETNLNLSITFRHTESTDALKSAATDKISHVIQKYIHKDAEANIVLSLEKLDHTAEVHLVSKGYDVAASATTDNMYSAIDKLCHQLSTQLRRQKEKMVKNSRS